jgi:ribonucleotide monophosphatase NagD (HAD superfamily)
MSAPSEGASVEKLLSIVTDCQAFLFDLDGTIWKGNSVIKGAKEVLELLRLHVSDSPLLFSPSVSG